MKQRLQTIQRYLNPVAILHLMATATYSTLIAGRGFGKSFINGLKQARKVELMPRSVGLFTSPTYSMIYTKTLIPMKAAWAQHLNYIEDVHYVVGKVPPKHFAKPYHKPHRYENVITFWNGRTIVFGSFDRPALISGGSYDDADNDESYLIDKEDYDNYVIPTLRGTHPSFRDCIYHLQQTHTSSMPFRGNGDYLLDYYTKAKSSPDMYAFIGWEPGAKIQLGSTWMNVGHLGKKAILAMKAEMDKNSYKLMILNQRITSWGNLFYPVLSRKHWFTPAANDKVISHPLASIEYADATFDIGPDNYDPDRPIHISHDWGVFNCITIDQEYPREIRFINQMHVYNPDTIVELANKFCNYYRMHRNKLIYQYGDKSGNNRQANSKNTYFDEFASRLRDKGWRVIRKRTGDVEYLERHLFISMLHREDNPKMPIIRHSTRCIHLRASLEGAGMIDNKKDKSTERNPAIKPELSTHYSDAYDYRLFFGLKDRDKFNSGSSGSSL